MFWILSKGGYSEALRAYPVHLIGYLNDLVDLTGMIRSLGCL